MLKIGQIDYANCTPLFTQLREEFPCTGYEFITGVPAALNSMLLAGTIDVCPSSSIEYAYHPERYSIVPELSISSSGPVASVLLFSTVPIEELDGCHIRLSSESATSVNLLKILLALRYNCQCSFETAVAGGAVIDSTVAALLLIGDAALRASQEMAVGQFVYDLGELWFAWTSLPFVFALWLCRNEIAEKAELTELARQLVIAKEHVPARLEDIVEGAPETAWMGKKRLLSYWKDNISYDLDGRAQAGLRLYYTRCCECGLIAATPELRFAAH